MLLATFITTRSALWRRCSQQEWNRWSWAREKVGWAPVRKQLNELVGHDRIPFLHCLFFLASPSDQVLLGTFHSHLHCRSHRLLYRSWTSLLISMLIILTKVKDGSQGGAIRSSVIDMFCQTLVDPPVRTPLGLNNATKAKLSRILKQVKCEAYPMWMRNWWQENFNCAD